MLDLKELSRLRWRIAAGMGLALAFAVLGAAIGNGLASDLAYSVMALLLLSMIYAVVRWAQCSRLVQWLIRGAIFCLIVAQLLDTTENYQALSDIPVLGHDSRWNGKLSSMGIAVGLALTFAALTFALVEARLGRIAQERYGLLAENVSDVIFTADLNLTCSYISPSITRLCGVTVEEVLARQPGEGMTSASFARASQLLKSELERARQGLRRPEDASVIDLELVREDGSTLWVETSVRFLVDDSGEPCGVLGVTRDITERKRAEAADRQLNERLTLAIRAGHLGVWDWDVNTNALVWDERMYEIFGVELGQFGGVIKDWRSVIEPGDLARAERELAAAIRGTRELNAKFRVIRPNGEIRHVQSQAVVRRDEAGRAQRMIGMNTDITEQVEAEAERARLREQLSQAQKMESIGRLAGGVAHDFNNMLMVILGRTELAMSARDLDEVLRGHMEEIRRAALRSSELTRQLLAFSRQHAVTPKVIDLNLAAEDMSKLLERLIGEDIRLSWRPGGDLWQVKMDPSQFDQILANLCVNARDAIAGGGEISIQTSNVALDAIASAAAGFVSGEYVRLTVSDTGCGMNTETLARIYEPFFTTKTLGKGTGLGLSTVYGIVKQNNGFISVKSALGQGTTFTVHLPRYIGVEKDEADDGEAAAPPASGQERILLVEDERAIREVAQIILERLGYTVLAAATPGEAIRIAESQSEPIQLLLTDIVMPEMNGRDLTVLLARRYPGMKYLFMSGFTADLVSEDDILREGKNFIQKPFGMMDLAAKVRHALEQPDRAAGE